MAYWEGAAKYDVVKKKRLDEKNKWRDVVGGVEPVDEEFCLAGKGTLLIF